MIFCYHHPGRRRSPVRGHDDFRVVERNPCGWRRMRRRREMLRSWKLLYLVMATLAALAAVLVAAPKILSETIPYIKNEIIPIVWSVAPEGCRLVRFTQPNMNPSEPDVYLTLRGPQLSVDTLKFCNTAKGSNVFGVYFAQSASSRIGIRTKNGSGLIALPDNAEVGEISLLVCAKNGGNIIYKVYSREWFGILPQEVKLVEITDKYTGTVAESHYDSYYRERCRNYPYWG